MRLVAKEVPFSSVVGKSVVLTNYDSGEVIAQLHVMVPSPKYDYKKMLPHIVPHLMNAFPARTVGDIPTKAGHYWGKWRIKDEGTADPDDPPKDGWEVMQVFEDLDDTLLAFVPGVEHPQSVENFHWGHEVIEP